MRKDKPKKNTRERMREIYMIILSECKKDRKTIDELKSVLYQNNVELSRESVYAYVQRMKESVEIKEAIKRVKFGNVKCYSIAQDVEINVFKLSPLRKVDKPVEADEVIFNPPRTPLINKLFGLAA